VVDPYLETITILHCLIGVVYDKVVEAGDIEVLNIDKLV